MNMNQERRDEIIGNKFESSEYEGGIKRFEKITLNQLAQLIEEGFADKNDAQNLAPAIGKLYAFAKKFKKVVTCFFSGYVVDKDRPDYRTSIDELNVVYDKTNGNTIDMFIEMASLTKDNDEENFNESNPYRVEASFWWD